MVASLRDLCASAPIRIRRPPAGSALLSFCEAADNEPWPTNFEGYIETARQMVDRDPRADVLAPFYREIAYVSDVLRRAIELSRLRSWQLAERGKPDQHEGLAVFSTVGLFLRCGGTLAPDDNEEAHVRAAHLLGPGIDAADIANTVSIYTAATGHIIHDDAHFKWQGQPAQVLAACLRVAMDLLEKHSRLLDHTYDNAVAAAAADAEFDRQYQPVFNDPHG